MQSTYSVNYTARLALNRSWITVHKFNGILNRLPLCEKSLIYRECSKFVHLHSNEIDLNAPYVADYTYYRTDVIITHIHSNDIIAFPINQSVENSFKTIPLLFEVWKEIQILLAESRYFWLKKKNNYDSGFQKYKIPCLGVY